MRCNRLWTGEPLNLAFNKALSLISNGVWQVGLCAITCALTMFAKVYATDLYLPRLEYAKRHGAIGLSLDELRTALAHESDGQGADVILEVVGQPSAIVTAMELARPTGIISSCGVHGKTIPMDGEMLYDKK